jgi:hypothetical protein
MSTGAVFTDVKIIVFATFEMFDQMPEFETIEVSMDKNCNTLAHGDNQ